MSGWRDYSIGPGESERPDPFIGASPDADWNEAARRHEAYERGVVRRPPRAEVFDVAFYSVSQGEDITVRVEVESDRRINILTPGLCDSDEEAARRQAIKEWEDA